MRRRLLKLSKNKSVVIQKNSLLSLKLPMINFSMKIFLVSLIIFMYSFTGTAQVGQSDKTTTISVGNQNSGEKTGIALYLQRTERSIYADQKHLIANNLNQKNVDLSNAITLQEYAMKLYELGKEKEALICSGKARQIGVVLLTNFKGAEYASYYDNFEGEDAQLAEIKKDTSTVEYWLTKAKQ